MPRTIFVNLPVADLRRAVDFYVALGFATNPDFSDDTAACVVVDDNIFVMLLTEPTFKGYITGDVAPPGTTEVLTCISTGSKAEVDGMLARALAAGGTPWLPSVDAGAMYYSTFADPDGHVWEVMFMEGTG
ncbi:VOC family protein [Aquipuribacter sp. MA13-6]|uniref:VOC family protein n=1 Tax=unclassified Aquipuribacter TaxID=2635084 RepID=UPI003EEB0863